MNIRRNWVVLGLMALVMALMVANYLLTGCGGTVFIIFGALLFLFTVVNFAIAAINFFRGRTRPDFKPRPAILNIILIIVTAWFSLSLYTLASTCNMLAPLAGSISPQRILLSLLFGPVLFFL